MKTKTLKQLLLYNYRFFFAYTLLIIFGLFFLLWRLTELGPGLASLEITGATHHLSLDSIIQDPYYPVQAALQWISMRIFGISILSLRLPSVIFGAATVVILYHLLKRWFNQATAVLSSALFVSADWFLYITRIGSGVIEFSFWLTLVLLSLIKLVEKRHHWLPLFTISLAMLIWSPFGIYVSTFIIFYCCWSKFFRSRIWQVPHWLKAISLVPLIASTSLVALSVWNNHQIAQILLGFYQIPSPLNYLKNLLVNTTSIVVVTPKQNPMLGPSNMLFVRFFELIFGLFGVAMLWKTRVNELHRILLGVIIILCIAAGFSDRPRTAGLLLIPAIITITAGLRHLRHRWRQTFPKNPYARMASLIPTGALLASVLLMHYFSYFVLWGTQTQTHQVFQQDLPLLQKELSKHSGKNCLVISGNQQLITLTNYKKPNCNTSFANQVPNKLPSNTLVIAEPAKLTNSATLNTKPITNSVSKNNVRWLAFNTNDIDQAKN